MANATIRDMVREAAVIGARNLSASVAHAPDLRGAFFSGALRDMDRAAPERSLPLLLSKLISPSLTTMRVDIAGIRPGWPVLPPVHQITVSSGPCPS